MYLETKSVGEDLCEAGPIFNAGCMSEVPHKMIILMAQLLFGGLFVQPLGPLIFIGLLDSFFFIRYFLLVKSAKFYYSAAPSRSSHVGCRTRCNSDDRRSKKGRRRRTRAGGLHPR